MGEVSTEGLGARALPAGTVTFLFTDLEGSTAPQQAHPAAYAAALRRHHDLLRGASTRRRDRAPMPMNLPSVTRLRVLMVALAAGVRRGRATGRRDRVPPAAGAPRAAPRQSSCYVHRSGRGRRLPPPSRRPLPPPPPVPQPRATRSSAGPRGGTGRSSTGRAPEPPAGPRRPRRRRRPGRRPGHRRLRGGAGGPERGLGEGGGPGAPHQRRRGPRRPGASGRPGPGGAPRRHRISGVTRAVLPRPRAPACWTTPRRSSGLGVVWPSVAVRRGWGPACWGPWGCPLLPHFGRAGGLGGAA